MIFHKNTDKNIKKIRFIRGPKTQDNIVFGSILLKKSNKLQLNENLNDPSFYYKILHQLARNFKLTTNNGSCLFNMELLKDTSSVISAYISENHNTLEYHIDINDPENILCKFEKLYQGEDVFFNVDELPISKKITGLLNITCCPNYMKPESLKTNEKRNSQLGLEDGVSIDLISFNSVINQPDSITYTISTKNNEYKCNYYGIFSSKIIHDFIIKNPFSTKYDYDYEDENGEFQLICNFFNFKHILITTDNMYELKEMADNLKIDSISSKINQFVDAHENFTKNIDDQQTTVDLIEELFDWLFNIKKYSVENVVTSIMDSNWIKTEDEVIELAAFIIHVMQTSIYLHPYLIELLIQLDKKSNESKELKVLIPFIVKRLKFSIWNKSSYCSFFYNLYKKEIVTKEELFDTLDYQTKNIKKFNFALYWFLPEFVELNKMDLYKEFYVDDFITPYYPDKIDLFIQMRDKGEPDDELTKALRIDDVDKVQSILSQNSIDFSRLIVPFNIFDNFNRDNEMTLIDYAAAFGSIKCFKYLMLNDSKITKSTFKYAIYGGNTEIIKITDQNLDQKQNQNQQTLKSFHTINRMNIYGIYDISSAIEVHHNDLFDWILEQKYQSKLAQGDKPDSLLLCSAKNGNAYAFIEIIDRYSPSIEYQKFIEKACMKGFFKLANLIINVMGKEPKNKANTNELMNLRVEENIRKQNLKFICGFASYGNLSIFKLGQKFIVNEIDFTTVLETCILKRNMNILDYCFDEIIKKDNSKLTEGLVLNVASRVILFDYSLDYLFEKIKQIKPDFFEKFDSISKLLKDSCACTNIENIKLILNTIKDNKKDPDITLAFIQASYNKSIDICQYIIDDKYFYIDFQQFLTHNLGSLNKDNFSIIFENSSPELQESLLYSSLHDAILKSNKELAEFLLNKNANKDHILFDAIFTNNAEMVKYVLSIPGIDVNECLSQDGNTPLITAIMNYKHQIVEVLVNDKRTNINAKNNENLTALKLLRFFFRTQKFIKV